MTLARPGHNAPSVGFEVPLEMLAACHGRIQQQCDTLQRLLTHLERDGATRPAQEAARAVIRYFDTAARHHHEDEGFIQLYEQHIAREEAELLPMAARLLSDAELDRIGLLMRNRRTP